jgi:hypothetical protein
VLTAYGTTKAAGGEADVTGIGLLGNIGPNANQWTPGEILLPDALSTRTHKSALSYSGRYDTVVRTAAGRWASTAAITSVTLYAAPDSSFAPFAAGSTFELCVVDESFNIDQDGDGQQILGSDGTFSVGSISAADGDLVCIGNVRSDREANWDAMDMKLNSDATGGNYPTQWLYGVGTGTHAWTGTTLQVADGLPDENNAAGVFGAFVSQITNFSDGSNDRVVTTLSGAHAPAAPRGEVNLITTRWNNTSAVTAIDYEASNSSTGNFVVGSMLSTYAVPKNLIERQEITGSTSDPTVVTFSDVPQTYDHLELSIYARTDRDSQTLDYVYMEFNDDATSANYPRQVLRGAATTASAFQQDLDAVLTITGNTGTANAFGSGAVTIYNYTKTDRHTHRLSAGGHDVIFDLISSRWENTAAVTKIHLHNAAADDFQVGSVFTLRGINSTVAAATSDVAALNGIAPADIEAVN